MKQLVRIAAFLAAGSIAARHGGGRAGPGPPPTRRPTTSAPSSQGHRRPAPADRKAGGQAQAEPKPPGGRFVWAWPKGWRRASGSRPRCGRDGAGNAGKGSSTRAYLLNRQKTVKCRERWIFDANDRHFYQQDLRAS